MKIGNAIRQDGLKLDYFDRSNLYNSEVEYELETRIRALIMKMDMRIYPSLMVKHENWK